MNSFNSRRVVFVVDWVWIRHLGLSLRYGRIHRLDSEYGLLGSPLDLEPTDSTTLYTFAFKWEP